MVLERPSPTVLYQGLLRSPASWARVGRGYLKELLRLGVSLAAVSPRGFGYDASFALPPGLREISLAEARDGSEPDIGLGFLHPPLVDRLIGTFKANLFVWESDRAPIAWIDPMQRHVDLTVVPSVFTCDALVASGMPSNRVAVVPYGYDSGSIASLDDTRPPPVPFTFLAVAAPHLRKGIRELFAAYRRAFTSRDEVLLHVKSTHDPADSSRRFPFQIRSWEEALVEGGLRQPNAPPVRIDLETVDDDSMLQLLAQAHVYVQPSYGESFGLGIVEAMACGRPAITTGWGGQVEYTPDGDDRLPYRTADAGDTLYEAVPGAHVGLPDIDALASRLRWHYENAEASRRLGLEARRHVEPFTWARGAEKLLDVLAAAG